MKRRQFNTMLGAAGLTLSEKSHAAEPSVVTVRPEVIKLSRNGWMPNNEQLTVLLYRHAVSIEGHDPAAVFEALFQGNGWPPQWRDGVYDFTTTIRRRMRFSVLYAVTPP